MTRWGMVVLGTIAMAAAIAVAVSAGRTQPEEAKPSLTPAQAAEMRPAPEPRKQPAASISQKGSSEAAPQDGDAEDGDGS
ncbi:MAG TPA: hypothetical protein VKH65_17010 [Myxococcales bacterium]|nr:hypothetical protein [Myxococcales bacterium]